MKRHSCYILISIGLIFLLDIISIKNFIILPDVIGYILILLGTKRLAEISLNSSFKKTVKLLYGAIVLSLFALPYLNSINATINMITGFILFFVDILIVFFLLEGLAAIYRDENNEALFKSAHKTWKFYLYLQFIIFVVAIPGLPILNFIASNLTITSILIVIICLLKSYKNDKQKTLQQ